MKIEPFDSLFGIPVTTHRSRNPDALFLYGLIISTISIVFFRTTIYQRNEPAIVRIFFTLVLASLTYSNQSYELISAVEIFSYTFSMCFFGNQVLTWVIPSKVVPSSSSSVIVIRLLLIAISAILSFVGCHITASGEIFTLLGKATPKVVMDGLSWMFPIEEVTKAYEIMDEYVMTPGLLKSHCARLLFITFHIQVGMGYLGINFLNEEQHRRNQLVRMDMIGSDDADNDSKDDDSDTKRSESSKINGTTAPKKPTKPIQVTAATKARRATRFQRSALPFILFTAVPYMIQIIGYGNINSFAFTCFKDEMHRAVRLHELFEHDNHLVAMATNSPKAPQAYGDYMSTVVTTTYDIFNRKLFSLPKILLLPGMMAKQPQMLVQIFPIIFATDWLKGKAIAFMTTRIEALEKETQQLTAIRSKVEAFDMKNAELLQRAGPNAIGFTGKRWEDLTVAIQTKTVVKDLVTRTKNFFRFIHRNFVFVVLVDCALAHLIAVGKIIASEIFVFSRAIEDAVDMALMRSRSEAELARLMTQIENLKELSAVWENAKQQNTIPCNVVTQKELEHAAESSEPVSLVVLRNLQYSRGTANVRIDHMELKAGVYALTGANGSGKSTLFRVLMSCSTNERSIDLPPSITLHTPASPLVEVDDMKREAACEAAEENATELRDAETEEGTATATISENGDVAISKTDDAVAPSIPPIDATHPRLSITMPSSRVVEISQTFYWPLYSKPIDWIYQEHLSDTLTPDALKEKAHKVAEELFSLEFTQKLSHGENGSDDEHEGLPKEEAIEGIIKDLLEEKEDWFGDLSGGQKSKVELVRKVFLHDECPHVLLIDETMAPLDPSSKIHVMAKLKNFCLDSVMIVIYHTDVGQEQETEQGNVVECVPSNNFFDGNIHVENQLVNLKPLC